MGLHLQPVSQNYKLAWVCEWRIQALKEGEGGEKWGKNMQYFNMKYMILRLLLWHAIRV